MKPSFVCKCLLAFWCAVVPTGFLAAYPDETETYEPGALYIKFQDGSIHYPKSPQRTFSTRILFNQKGFADRYAIKEQAYSMHIDNSPELNNVFRIEFDSTHRIDALIEELRRDRRIIFIERVPRHRIQSVETESKNFPGANDFFSGNMDGIETTWFWEMIGMEEMANYSGKTELKVAVVDNAVWGEHEDLQIAPKWLYDTFIGIPGTAKPPRTVLPSSEDAYGWSHGTHCAGLIGAITGNGKGVASLASGVTVLGVKCSENTSRDIERAYQGVLWAMDQDAKVISMSLGSSVYSAVEESVIQEAIRKGIVVIAAAGNEGKDNKNYPGAYPGVICVASIDSDGMLSEFSNFGTWVDIAAPGGFFKDRTGQITASNIFSTTYCLNRTHADKENFRDKHYDGMQGTSMATPIAASLVSLLLSYYPDLNAYQVKDILQNSSKALKTTAGRTIVSGYISAPDAFGYMEKNDRRRVRNLTAYLNGQGEIEVRWEQPEDMAGFEAYRIYKNDSIWNTETTEFFNNPLNDTTFLIGVKPLYQDGEGLLAYTTIAREDPNVATENQQTIPAYGFHVRNRRLYLDLTAGETERPILIRLYDYLGRPAPGAAGILQPYATDGLNLSGLNKGLYIVSVRDGDATRAFKIVL